MAWFLSNLRYVAWTALAVGALFLIYFAMGQAGYGFGDPVFWESLLALDACALGHHVDRPPLLFQFHADSERAEDSGRASRSGDRQGDRAGGAVLVSLGRDGDARHRRSRSRGTKATSCKR